MSTLDPSRKQIKTKFIFFTKSPKERCNRRCWHVVNDSKMLNSYNPNHWETFYKFDTLPIKDPKKKDKTPRVNIENLS